MNRIKDAHDVVTEVLWKQVFRGDSRRLDEARSAAYRAVDALRREGYLYGYRAADTTEIIEKVSSRADGEAPMRGISHLVAEALVLLSLPVVHRETVKALMPSIDKSATGQTIKVQFNRALRKFHQWKWIERIDGDLIAVNNLDALSQWFLVAEDKNSDRAATTLDIAKAVAALAADDPDELRRQELLALQAVMTRAPGSATGARGQVRLVPKGSAL